MTKFNNPLEQMAAMPESKAEVAPKPARRRQTDFTNPLAMVSDNDKARAVGSSLVAGQYIRRTFTFTPGQLRRIKALARDLHIAETGVARWLIDEGLRQWERGVRPELEQQAVKLEPKLQDW